MMDDSPSALIAEMQAYYGRRAEIYDASMGYDTPDVLRSLEPVIAALCDAMRDRTVLEIACGPGFWTQRVADAATAIAATDYNDSALAMARAKAIAPARVRFVRADAYDLSALDGAVPGTFTGAFAVDWLAHVPTSRIAGFLDGLHRRLAPRARVAFCDQTPGPVSLTGRYDAEGNHLQERALPDGSRHRVIKHFFSDDELRQLVNRRGEDITIQRFSVPRRVLLSYTVSPA
ncbi:MAG TPA: class I SAM-dependent methyltransferase [Gemmatimonadaceae bacterium]|nr:class I SAM-dependent methyltransferase [Gemmatimonadaceae bacterium]